MKISIPSKPVESGGIRQQGEFRIKNSAKAFSILSSGLYSNKYQAILRELGCNAYDSHVEAGKGDVPFVVHLPSKLNPTFSVRDYGIGLDHRGVVDIYTTYFESTKQDSNEYVGCMGLGSKSPFSYTDNFSVTATKNKIKRLYSAFINEHGVPTIALLHEEKTDEENGVEVSFAVNERHDMHRFREEAARVYMWFKVKPTITGQEITIPEIKYAEQDIIPGVHIRKENNYNYRSCRSYATMGNVAYPIKLDEAEKDGTKENKRHNDIRTMYENGALVVEFNIGDLDIAASREELSYIPHTIDSIYRKGEEIIQQLGLYIENELSEANTKWKRMEVLNRLYESNKNLFAPAITSYIKKNPRKFFKHTQFNLYGSKTYFSLREFENISEHLNTSYYSIEKRYADSTMIAHRMKKANIREDTNDGNMIAAYEVNQNVVVVMQDDKGGLLPRIKAGVREKTLNGHRILAFRVTNKDADKNAIYKKVRRLLGNPTVVWSSSLPKTNTANSTNKNFSVYTFNSSYRNRYENGYVLKLKTDIPSLVYTLVKDKKYVYVPLNHKSIDFKTNTSNPSEFMKFVESNEIDKFLNINKEHIYGVNKAMQKLIVDNNEWINLFDLFVQEFYKIDWKSAQNDARKKYMLGLLNSDRYDFSKLEYNMLLELKNDRTPFGRLVTFYDNSKDIKGSDIVAYDKLINGMKKIIGQHKELDTLLKSINIDQTNSDIKNLLNEIEKIYPMLKHLRLSGWGSSNDWKDAHGYIKLVDNNL